MSCIDWSPTRVVTAHRALPDHKPRAAVLPTGWRRLRTTMMASLRRVVVPVTVLDMFADIAHENTACRRETMGIICGSLVEGQYVASTVIIPDQRGDSTSCSMTDEGCNSLLRCMQEEKLVQTAWIHTHPGFDVFMSSVDLHTQCMQQISLPEMVAIVINPQHDMYGACYGAYSLTTRGQQLVGACKQRGHHPSCTSSNHSSSLYQHAAHFSLATADHSIHGKDLRQHIQHLSHVSRAYRWRLTDCSPGHSPKPPGHPREQSGQAPPQPPNLAGPPRTATGLAPPLPPNPTGPPRTVTGPAPPLPPNPTGPPRTATGRAPPLPPNPTGPPRTATGRAPPLPPNPTGPPRTATGQAPPPSTNPAGQQGRESVWAPTPTDQPGDESARAPAIIAATQQAASQYKHLRSQRPELRGSIQLLDHQYQPIDLQEKTFRILHACEEYMEIEQDCSIALATSPYRSAVIQLENAIINAYAGNLTCGIVYAAAFVVNDRCLYTRWMDSGVLSGFLHQHWSTVQKLAEPFRPQLSAHWQIMTSSDLQVSKATYETELAKKRSCTPGKCPAEGTGRRWDQTIIKNSKGVTKSHANLTAPQARPSGSIQLLGTIVSVLKKTHNLLSKTAYQDLGIHFQSGIFSSWECQEQLNAYRVHGNVPRVASFQDLLDRTSPLNLSLEHQEEIINSIDNNPSTSGRSGMSYFSYFSTGTCEESSNDPPVSKYLPSSNRNLMLYRWRLGQRKQAVDAIHGPGYFSRKRPNPCNNLHSSKAARTERPVASTADNEAGDIPAMYIPTESAMPITSFQQFLFNLTEENGVLAWRIHGEGFDVIAMNDINLDKGGRFLVNKFVHVSRQEISGSLHYSCHCQMYHILLRGGDSPICIHVRFLKEYVEPHYNQLFPSRSLSAASPLLIKLKKAMNSLNVGAVKLGTNQTFQRFSILSPDMRSSAIVNMQNGRVSCQFGECRALKGHSRKVVRIDAPGVCAHLQLLCAHEHLWKSGTDLGNEADNDGGVLSSDSEDERNLTEPAEADSSQVNKFFDPETGLWDFPSVSIHKPRQLDDVILIDALAHRAAISPEATGVKLDSEGLFLKDVDSNIEPFVLKPGLPEEPCHCGASYSSDGLCPAYAITTKVFMRHGVAKFQVYNLECPEKAAACLVEYSGSLDGIHILSSHTAAGDEIGWDFINTVSKAQVSFSAFCDIMSERYNFSDAKFMSRQTFTEWIFSWLSKFKIDFRNPCLDCQFTPSVLACDATKLGMFLKNINISPLETPTSEEYYLSKHTRSDRQFFAFGVSDTETIKQGRRHAREDLSYFVAKNKNSLKEWVKKSQSAKDGSDCSKAGTDASCEELRKKHVLDFTPSECVAVMQMFIEQAFNQDVLQALCSLFQLFTTSHALSSFINFRLVPDVMRFLDGDVEVLVTLRQEIPELCNIIDVSKKFDEFLKVAPLLRYLCSAISEVHSNDRDSAAVNDGLESYNPELLGRAYYFTRHGGRIRDLPTYSLSRSKGSYDAADKRALCKKFFPEVAKEGTTYLFLWFDPIHGHCYGFHIVVNSEGRKDPFSSLYLHAEKPPAEIFYDFSCQLEEYCLNREPKFWRNSRFFHDIFHGFSHKCPFVYNCRRVPALDVGINSEICEQFNAYIKKIKFSARSMNQSHFVFFLQFFIHMWNEKKRKDLLRDKATVESLQS